LEPETAKLLVVCYLR